MESIEWMNRMWCDVRRPPAKVFHSFSTFSHLFSVFLHMESACVSVCIQRFRIRKQFSKIRFTLFVICWQLNALARALAHQFSAFCSFTTLSISLSLSSFSRWLWCCCCICHKPDTMCHSLFWPFDLIRVKYMWMSTMVHGHRYIVTFCFVHFLLFFFLRRLLLLPVAGSFHRKKNCSTTTAATRRIRFFSSLLLYRTVLCEKVDETMRCPRYVRVFNFCGAAKLVEWPIVDAVAVIVWTFAIAIYRFKTRCAALECESQKVIEFKLLISRMRIQRIHRWMPGFCHRNMIHKIWIEIVTVGSCWWMMTMSNVPQTFNATIK